LLLNSTWHLTPCQAEADLAAANATIAAQRLALATMREVLSRECRAHMDRRAGKFVCGWYECSQEAEKPDQIPHTEDCMWAILAQPADAAAMAVAVLAAADQMTEMMALMLGEEDEPDGDGGDVLIRMARARSAYRRARAALRVHGAVEG
jgi:hypothetical protein